VLRSHSSYIEVMDREDHHEPGRLREEFGRELVEGFFGYLSLTPLAAAFLVFALRPIVPVAWMIFPCTLAIFASALGALGSLEEDGSSKAWGYLVLAVVSNAVMVWSLTKPA
jgi:hypothetical protein